jgi:hypothetical protein
MWTFIIEEITVSENKFTVLFTLLRNGEKYRRESIVVQAASLINVVVEDRAKYIQGLVDVKCQELTITQDIKADFSPIIGIPLEVTAVKYPDKEIAIEEIKP